MMDKNLKFDTLEGYVHTVKLVQALASYLKKHGWEKKILFHIHDEPDIHVKNQAALESRRRQYYLAEMCIRDSRHPPREYEGHYRRLKNGF